MQVDIQGRKFGMLTVICETTAKNIGGRSRTQVLCKCDCGQECIKDKSHVMSGHTRSCGCLLNRPRRNAPREFHGKSHTPLYAVWSAIFDRCMNPGAKAYARYGGRGISVCKEWMSYSAFEEWAMLHGYKRGLEIDRIDNDGDYTPENCRWVTHAINLQNTHRRQTVIVDGIERNLAEFARTYGERYNDIYNLKHRGKSGDEIIEIINRRQKLRGKGMRAI